jgi:virulence-associated protein VapD
MSFYLYFLNVKRCKGVTTMGYSVQEASKILRMPYSSIRRWVSRHNVSVTTGITGKVYITEEGMEELRTIVSIKNQIKEIVRQRFNNKKESIDDDYTNTN